MIKPNSNFNFIQGNEIQANAPANCEIYVHFADNGKGKMQIHGKILRIDQEQNETHEKQTTEIGWVRPEVEFPANDADLFNKGHQSVIDKIKEINPEVEFEII